MLFRNLYSIFKSFFMGQQMKTPRGQTTRRSWPSFFQLGGSVREARQTAQRRPYLLNGERGDIRPFAFTRSYWLRRRDALYARLFQLYSESGKRRIRGDVAEIWRSHEQVCSKPMRNKPLHVQALRGRVGVLWGRLVQATEKGDVPGGAALLEQVKHCDKILLYEDKWWMTQPRRLRPEAEVDLCSLAAFAVQRDATQQGTTPGHNGVITQTEETNPLTRPLIPKSAPVSKKSKEVSVTWFFKRLFKNLLQRVRDMFTGRSQAARSLRAPVAKASPSEKRKAFWAAGEQGDPCPFVFTRTYWCQRRETLFSRIYHLWMDSESPEIKPVAAEIRRCREQLLSIPAFSDLPREEALVMRLKDLCRSLEPATKKGVVAGAVALQEQLEQCNRILIYEDNGYNHNAYLHPEHEVDLLAIADFAEAQAQSTVGETFQEANQAASMPASSFKRAALVR